MSEDKAEKVTLIVTQNGNTYHAQARHTDTDVRCSASGDSADKAMRIALKYVIYEMYERLIMVSALNQQQEAALVSQHKAQQALIKELNDMKNQYQTPGTPQLTTSEHPRPGVVNRTQSDSNNEPGNADVPKTRTPKKPRQTSKPGNSNN